MGFPENFLKNVNFLNCYFITKKSALSLNKVSEVGV